MSEVRQSRDKLTDERRAEIIRQLATIHELLIRAMPLSEVRAYTTGSKDVGGLAGMARTVDGLRAAVRQYGHGMKMPSDLLIPEADTPSEVSDETAPEVVDEPGDSEAARLLLERKADFSILAQMCAVVCQRRRQTQSLGISMSRMQAWLGVTEGSVFRASLERLESAGHISLSHLKVDRSKDTLIKVSEAAITAYLRHQRAARRP